MATARLHVSRSSLTYRAFADHAARAAAGFLRLGIGRTSAVALLLPNTPYHPISFFGALRARRASCI